MKEDLDKQNGELLMQMVDVTGDGRGSLPPLPGYSFPSKSLLFE